MMSDDGVGEKKIGTNGVVKEKKQEAEKEIRFEKEEDEKCIILYYTYKIEWNI